MFETEGKDPGLFVLQGGYIFLKELFEFFIGKHFFDQAEDGLLIFFVKLLDKPHLFHHGFVFNNHLLSNSKSTMRE